MRVRACALVRFLACAIIESFCANKMLIMIMIMMMVSTTMMIIGRFNDADGDSKDDDGDAIDNKW